MKRDPKYRFLINTNPYRLEVYDLWNEQKGPQECQIDEIVSYNHLATTTLGGLASWLAANYSYDGCAYCLPGYHTI